MKLTRLEDGWWIKDGDELYGPYTTKKEAEDDKRGLERFYKNEHRAGFVSVESKATRPVDRIAENVE